MGWFFEADRAGSLHCSKREARKCLKIRFLELQSNMNLATTLESCDPIERQVTPNDVSKQWVTINSDLKKLSSPIKLKNFSAEMKKRNLEVEFKVLQLITQTKDHIEKLCKDPIQFGLNRYQTILPYQYNLVQIRSSPEDSEYYINANYIKGGLPDCTYIATQAPMKNTVGHFWKMVDMNTVTKVIMLCSAQEKCKVQSFRYWPIEQDPDQMMEAPDHKVYLKSKHEVNPKLVERQLTLVNNQTKKETNITHYQLRGWNDNEAPQPECIAILTKLLELTLQWALDKQRILVHCSAGVGRTGSFIALLNLKSILHMFRQNNSEKTVGELEISIFDTVRQLREQRWGMVYRRDQYIFLYQYICKQIDKLLSKPAVSQ